MSKKAPTTSGVIVSTGTQIGLFQIVEYIASVFNANFNQVFYPNTATLPSETILHCFGLVDRYTKADGTSIPLMYSQSGGTLQDPIELLPTDRWAGYMFFDRNEPIQYSVPKNYTQMRGYVSELAKVNIIFFFNMKLQRYYTKWGYDYRIQKETLRERILALLTTYSPKKGAEFHVTSCTDGEINDVFKGYSTQDSELIANLQPYYALRFETTISYRYVDCNTTPLAGSVTPTTVIGISEAKRLILTKDIPYVVTFDNISVGSQSGWMFSGLPLCYTSGGENIGFDITDKIGTGFTVTANENSTFDYSVIKI